MSNNYLDKILGLSKAYLLIQQTAKLDTGSVCVCVELAVFWFW
jgi:hypothetical protein